MAADSAKVLAAQEKLAVTWLDAVYFLETKSTLPLHKSWSQSSLVPLRPPSLDASERICEPAWDGLTSSSRATEHPMSIQQALSATPPAKILTILMPRRCGATRLSGTTATG